MKKIKIYVKKNCSNCLQTLELFKQLKDFKVEEVQAEDHREEVESFTPKTKRWEFPVCLFFAGDNLLNVTTGKISNIEETDLPYKELQELQAMAYRAKRDVQNFTDLTEKSKSNAAFLEQIIFLKEQVELKDELNKAEETKKK